MSLGIGYLLPEIDLSVQVNAFLDDDQLRKMGYALRILVSYYTLCKLCLFVATIFASPYLHDLWDILLSLTPDSCRFGPSSMML